MIIFLTQDLMMLSSARSVVPSTATLKPASNIERIRQLNQSDEIHLLLVDLQTPSLKIDDLSSLVTEFQWQTKTVVFAQHVYVEILDQARDCFENVMTRGQFSAQLPKILESFD